MYSCQNLIPIYCQNIHTYILMTENEGHIWSSVTVTSQYNNKRKLFHSVYRLHKLYWDNLTCAIVGSPHHRVTPVTPDFRLSAVITHFAPHLQLILWSARWQVDAVKLPSNTDLRSLWNGRERKEMSKERKTKNIMMFKMKKEEVKTMMNHFSVPLCHPPATSCY